MQKKSVPITVLLMYSSIVFFFASCGSSTCSKTVPCPGYNDTLLNTWFPYYNKQLLLFKSSLNSLNTLNLQLADSTMPYTTSTGYDRPSASCSAVKSLVSIQKDSNSNPLFSITLNEYSGGYSTTETKSASFSFSNIEFDGQNLTSAGFSGFTISYYDGGENRLSYSAVPQTLYNYSLNGNVFPVAQSITNDSAIAKNAPGVYKVIYAQNAGIIEYETNPGSIVWIKQ